MYTSLELRASSGLTKGKRKAKSASRHTVYLRPTSWPGQDHSELVLRLHWHGHQEQRHNCFTLRLNLEASTLVSVTHKLTSRRAVTKLTWFTDCKDVETATARVKDQSESSKASTDFWLNLAPCSHLKPSDYSEIVLHLNWHGHREQQQVCFISSFNQLYRLPPFNYYSPCYI